MSELINNRQEKLKDIIMQIHNGLSLEEAKVIFKEQFGTVTTDEIVAMEHSLIKEGMPIETVQSLCGFFVFEFHFLLKPLLAYIIYYSTTQCAAA